jgi:hypothetical protein
MPLAQDQKAVEAFSPQATEKTLTGGVCPRRSIRRAKSPIFLSRWGKKNPHNLVGCAGDCQNLGGLVLVALVMASPSPIATTILVAPWLLWTSFCYIDLPPIQFLAVELSDGLFSGAILCHLDEGEPLGAARYAIRYEAHRGNLSHCSEKLG